MNYSLYYLAHLVCIKNELNRKRRRFYTLMSEPRWRTRGKGPDREAYQEKRHPAYTKERAKLGYEMAKLQMKAMTRLIREVRLNLGARLMWGDSGNIQAIKHEGKTYNARAPIRHEMGFMVYTGPNEIAALAEHHKVEEILKSA